jgi:hypothetical protein
MEMRRANETIPTVALTALGSEASPVMEACLVEMSGRVLRLRAPRPIPCGAPVKVEATDTLMLGEVIRCDPEGGAYTIGVQLSHSLAAVGGVARCRFASSGR